MKTFLKILAGLVVFVILLVGAVFYFTGGTLETADAFLGTLRSGDRAKIEAMLSNGFRKRYKTDDLMAYLKRSGLDRHSAVEWGKRSINSSTNSGTTGVAEGTVTTPEGDLFLRIELVDVDDVWKVSALKDKDGNDVVRSPIPDNRQLVELVGASMRLFAGSVLAKDMTPFYQDLSQLWRKQTTPAKLAEIFKVFIDGDFNLTGLETVSPIFDNEPRPDEKGVLVVKGHYPSRPFQVLFRFSYVREGMDWKMVGINVRTREAK